MNEQTYLALGGSTGFCDQRYDWLRLLFSKNNCKLTVSLKFSESFGKWTDLKELDYKELVRCPEIHRMLLPNEFVAESDNAEYYQNVDSSRIVSTVLEHKGFIPLHYYSGNKSIHTHGFFDFTCLLQLPLDMQNKIIVHYEEDKNKFITEFMLWLRKKATTVWGTRAAKFDEGLAKGKHLIRCEGSKHRLGYKTFVGCTTNSLSYIPPICSPDNGLVPTIGTYKLSHLNKEQVVSLVNEWWDDMVHARAAKAREGKQSYLDSWQPGANKTPPEITYMLSNDFGNIRDGFKRALHYIANDQRGRMSSEQLRHLLHDWNNRMRWPLRDTIIEWQLHSPMVYKYSGREYRDFLRDLGHSL